LDAARTNFEARDLSFDLDMAYVGQTHTVSVPLTVKTDGSTVAAVTRAEIETAFDATYKATYGRLLQNGVRRILNLRSAVTGKRPKFDLSTLAPPEGGRAEKVGVRRVHFGDKWYDTAIYDRLALPSGTKIVGPAILTQPDTTVLIEPHLQGRVDRFGNTIIEPQEE
ncbi:MAG: hydantoinase/oxoprolinase family protein, partial [Planktomarina temperata]|nr:hydantoinase/oxoprolinase family protein [Planktomarina temperata]